MIQEGSGVELVELIRNAKRALVFISVPWSSPERNGRKVFGAAVDRLELVFRDGDASFFRLEVDEDAVSQQWLSWIGYLQLAGMGAGSLLWLDAGKVMSTEINANQLGVNGIVERTLMLWIRGSNNTAMFSPSEVDGRSLIVLRHHPRWCGKQFVVVEKGELELDGAVLDLVGEKSRRAISNRELASMLTVKPDSLIEECRGFDLFLIQDADD
ncbi:MAG: hypothetical protein K8T91_00700 [Planctomycetes bacterium]|nr:hypothetical protein [Planctomycetota bacterium]